METKDAIVLREVIKKSDRFVYCVDCDAWDSTQDIFLERCRCCGSRHIHQAPHAKWAQNFRPDMGLVYHGLMRIPVMPGSPVFRVLAVLKAHYAAVQV